MSLSIIKGPPNSGRTERVRHEYIDLLPRKPVLIVPGIDDIFDWEKRLARERGAFLGGQIMHFKDLVMEVLDRAPDARPRVATGLERRHLVKLALTEAWPALGRRVFRQPGLVDSMLRLIDEFRQGLLDPDTIEENAREIESGYLESIIAVYRRYLDELSTRNLTDEPALAMAAVKSNLDAWQGRPVYVAGFDDLTEQQLELLVKLSEQTDVTIALTHEVGNPSMAVTENLLGRLEARGGMVRLTTTRESESGSESPSHAPVLLEIERDFERQATPGSLDPESGATSVMRSSGHRGEAEGVAARIARLIADGTEPDEIAIAVSSPASEGKRFRDALREYDIPVTLESETPAPETAVGRSILALLKAASPAGTAADFVRYLRGPTGSDRDSVDQLEFKLVRASTATAREAAAIFEQRNHAPPGWQEIVSIGSGDSVVPAIVLACDQLAGNILAVDAASPPGDSTVIEVQMSKAIGRACAELEEIGGSTSISEIGEALRSGAVTIWAIPTLGTVRIASPYSLRAKRFEYLFIVSLQERSLTGADRSGPFLNTDARKAIGLLEFMDPELQELYLFYSCLSVPTDGLWLSSRIADDSGKAEHPSPLVAAVERLFPAGALRRHGRRAEQIAYAVHDAPSRTELVRSLAAAPDPASTLSQPDLGLGETDRTSLETRLNLAVEVEHSTRTLKSLSCPASLEALSENLVFSATALESYRTCQYRWFIERALSPQRFGPAPEPMANGSLVHAVLKDVYDERPGRLPRPDDVDQWIEAVGPLVEQHAKDDELGLGSDSAAHRVVRRRAVNSITSYLQREAARQDPHFLPFQTEAGFGLDDEPVDMGGWWLRGSIDRIDVSGDPAVRRNGVIFDYKTGRGGVLSRANIASQHKLQLQLYMGALEKRWKITPVAALYMPVYRDTPGKLRGRGFADGDFRDDLEYLDCVGKDYDGDLRSDIDEAVAEASRTVAGILSGAIEHDPLYCVEHFKHPAIPDWMPDDAPDGTEPNDV